MTTKSIISKLFVLPIALFAVVLFGCKEVPAEGVEITYRDVIINDFYKDFHKKQGIELNSDLIISRSYIFVNGALAFDLSPKPDVVFGAEVKYTFDDVTVAFEHSAVPYIWLDHDFITLKQAYYDYKVYSIDDILKIHQMIENNENDFALLDAVFVEETNN